MSSVICTGMTYSSCCRVVRSRVICMIYKSTRFLGWLICTTVTDLATIRSQRQVKDIPGSSHTFVDGLFVDDLSADDLSVNGISVNNISVDYLAVDDLSVGDLYVAHLSLHNLSVDRLSLYEDNLSVDHLPVRGVN